MEFEQSSSAEIEQMALSFRVDRGTAQERRTLVVKQVVDRLAACNLSGRLFLVLCVASSALFLCWSSHSLLCLVFVTYSAEQQCCIHVSRGTEALTYTLDGLFLAFLLCSPNRDGAEANALYFELMIAGSRQDECSS